MSSKISWTNETWNPVIGCSKVSEGCRHCYAMRVAKGLADKKVRGYEGLTKIVSGKPEWTNVVRCLDEVINKPLGWKAPRRVFVNSMSDLFHPDVPFDFIDKVFAVMALCPQHTFQILTKRPERMAEYFNSASDPDYSHAGREYDIRAAIREKELMMGGKPWRDAQTWWPLKNVWLGTSVEDQKAADERIPHLLKCPAAVRFLSVEPLIGDVEIDKYLWGDCDHCDGLGVGQVRGPLEIDCVTCRGTGKSKIDGEQLEELHWIIVGGESGANRREMPLEAFLSVCQQVKAAGVPLFVKQDSAFQQNEQGRIPDEWWGCKEFPVAARLSGQEKQK